ncbi:hypothetical protein Sliba_54820 [Streptomyces nigrescens]|uniref:Uncharacterized protein n=1 Tax=Streptomyces nigrescens TaxID=1920 RepID=A0A640TNP0_STRNI|nr:hypothetical protein Sliba_54820 [Streptomyces libani subsp. libani]GGW04827.1 hypothetical protein GCM10010500_67550 [Streptomyces libani subsp. libani]
MGFLLWCGQGLIVPYGTARVECGCPGRGIRISERRFAFPACRAARMFLPVPAGFRSVPRLFPSFYRLRFP